LRNYIAPQLAVLVPKADKVNTVVERIDVKQGKLVLGFRVNKEIKASGDPQMRAFNDVFGGGPYSKLFANVREKLSLCYYCSARFDRAKNCLIIQCGCEEENMDKAVNEILNQLEEIKNGNFDDEFASSKIGLADNINSVNDDSLSLTGWYVSQMTDNEIISPAESVEKNNDVTKAEVQECASLLSLDTIYKLVGTKEGE
jgi:predicted Zn-dependent peptidase